MLSTYLRTSAKINWENRHYKKINEQKINKVNRILANFPLCNSDAMDLSVRKIEAVEMASPNTTRTSEPRNEITKKKTLSFSVDRLLKSSNSSEDSKLEGMKQLQKKLPLFVNSSVIRI